MGYERSLIHTYLLHVPMFHSCSEEQLDHLATYSALVDAHDGDAIISEGDAADAFYVLMTGKAKVSRGGQVVAELGEGDHFGELGLFDPTPRTATVTANGEVELLSLRREQFRQALDELPTMRDAILHGMAHLIHELNAST